MEHWSIRSNVVNYVQYDRNPKNLHELNVKALDQKYHKNMYDTLKEEGKQTSNIDFGDNPDKLKREYLDRYEGVQVEVLSTTRFDEHSDLSKTSLGRTDMTRETTIKAEEGFAISEQGYTI